MTWLVSGIIVPPVIISLSMYGHRAFAADSPAAWNLPLTASDVTVTEDPFVFSALEVLYTLFAI